MQQIYDLSERKQSLSAMSLSSHSYLDIIKRKKYLGHFDQFERVVA